MNKVVVLLDSARKWFLAGRIYFPRFFRIFFSQSDLRPMIEHIRNRNGNSNLVGVEIGVALGHNGKNILSVLPIEKLYLVDLYQSYLQDGVEIGHYQVKENAQKRLRKFEDSICFICKDSKDAAKHIPSGLDFVYIDGNHEYDYVKRDIELYYEKVKNGGVFGGHDFSAYYVGVCNAVLEFVDKYNLELNTKDVDWWVVKGKNKD